MKALIDGFLLGESGIYARLWRPQAAEPCPLVVIFHGFPGVEQNVDLAEALKEAGLAALIPYYNGSWGSKGDYRVERLPDNVDTVLSHVRGVPFAERYGIDTGRIAVAGHSLGALAALYALEVDPLLRGVVALDPAPDRRTFTAETPNPQLVWRLEYDARVLANVTLEQLMAGFRKLSGRWDPLRAIGSLGARFFMLVAASQSDMAPLSSALELYGKAKEQNPEAELWVLASDHSFATQRQMMRELVVGFLAGRL